MDARIRRAPREAARGGSRSEKSSLRRDVIALLVAVANGSAPVRSLQDVKQDARAPAA